MLRRFGGLDVDEAALVLVRVEAVDDLALADSRPDGRQVLEPGVER